MRILVVDDEVIIRKSIVKRLGMLALPIHEILGAANGGEALEIVRSTKVHIALVDINMPVLSGLELIQEIRRESHDIVLIIISGYDRFEYAKQAISLGVFAYLLKPIDEVEFQKTVYSAMEEVQKTQREVEQIPYSHSQDLILKKLQENIANPAYSMDNLAEELYLSRGHLSKIIKRSSGKTFTELLTSLRVQRAKQIIDESTTLGLKMYEVAELTGFSNQHYFSTVFKKHMGLSPNDYQKQIKGKKSFPY